jgi:hypothetical protein
MTITRVATASSIPRFNSDIEGPISTTFKHFKNCKIERKRVFFLGSKRFYDIGSKEYNRRTGPPENHSVRSPL